MEDSNSKGVPFEDPFPHTFWLKPHHGIAPGWMPVHHTTLPIPPLSPRPVALGLCLFQLQFQSHTHTPILILLQYDFSSHTHFNLHILDLSQTLLPITSFSSSPTPLMFSLPTIEYYLQKPFFSCCCFRISSAKPGRLICAAYEGSITAAGTAWTGKEMGMTAIGRRPREGAQNPQEERLQNYQGAWELSLKGRR